MMPWQLVGADGPTAVIGPAKLAHRPGTGRGWWGDRTLRWACGLAVVAHVLVWQVLHPSHQGMRAGQAHHSPVKVLMRLAGTPPLPQPTQPKVDAPEVAAADAPMVRPDTPPSEVARPPSQAAPLAMDPPAAGSTTAAAHPKVPQPAQAVPYRGHTSHVEGLTPEREAAILAMVPESYLPVDELDKTPELLGNWRINEAAIPQGKGRPDRITVTLRLWVSDQGHIDGFQVLNAQPLVPWLDDLLKTLDQSTMRPAERHGSPVASSWTIEFDLDFTGGF